MSVAPTSLVVVVDPNSGDEARHRILAAAARIRPGASLTQGDGWSAIALGDGSSALDARRFGSLPGVLQVIEVATPYRLAALEVLGVRRPVRVPALPGQVPRPGPCVGEGQTLVVIAACSGTTDDLPPLVDAVAQAGVRILHGGPFRHTDAATPMKLLHDLAAAHGLRLCLEVSDAVEVEEASELASMLLVGSRNMQDFRLLQAVGQTDRPVLLKRGAGATLEEFILAAEYVLLHGNGRVLLCESGIRTFDAVDRPRLEIAAIPLIRRTSHLPVLADPSAAAPRADLVPALTRAAVAAGADGLILDVGVGVPEGRATPIGIESLRDLIDQIREVGAAVGRTV